MAAVRDIDRTTSPPAPGRARRVLRLVVPVTVILAWLIGSGPLGQLSQKTQEVQKNDSSAFLPQSAESTKTGDLAAKFTPTQSTTGVVVYTRDGGLTGDDLAKIKDDAHAIADHLGGKLTGPPSEPIVSADHQAAQVLLPFAANAPDKLSADVDWIRDRIAHREGLATHVTGLAGFLADFNHAFAGIDGVLVLVTVLIVLVILLLVYRSPILPIAVLFAAAFALTVANGVVYLLAKHDVITLNGQSAGILDVLVLGAGTDYALLFASRCREELRRHHHRVDAVLAAWRAVLPPIVASGSTVIVGLMCLLLSGLKSSQGLGPVGGIGITAAMLAMLTLLPAILAVFGRVAFWPFRPKYQSQSLEERGFWPRVAGLVGRRPRTVWVATALALAAVSFGVLQLNANGIPQDKTFTKTQDSVTGEHVLADHFPAGTGSPTTIVAKADHFDEVFAQARGGDIADVVPYTGQQPDSTGRVSASAPPKVVDGLVRLDVTLSVPPDSQRAYDAVVALRSRMHAIAGADAKVGGFSAVTVDIQDNAKRDRTLIIPVVLVVIFAILVLLLRSLLAPLALMATVVLSYFAAIGACGLVFHNLFRFPAADSAFPLFVFVFLVALGVDYNIFLMTRVREEVGRRGHRAGTLAGLTATGGVITSAGLVLAATFAALSVLPVLFLAQLAFAVAFGVLLDTVVVRSLLVPALILELGRVVWWPSRLARAQP